MPVATPETEVFEDARTDEEDAVASPWNVVVHNDPITKMDYVTMVFQRLFNYARERAERHMMEVPPDRPLHRVEAGTVSGGELYVQQLHGYQLLATLEKSA